MTDLPADDIQAETRDLLIEAEIASEHVVSILRMCVAGGLLAIFAVTVGPVSDFDEPMQQRQWLFAATTMSAYFAVGLGAWLLCRAGRMRRWIIWMTVVTDCAFLLANIWLSLLNTGLPGQAIFVLPPAWLVPIALAFAMLRVNPVVQIFTASVLVLGLAGMLVFDRPLDPTQFDLGEDIPFFLAMPPNLMRLIMIALTGAVLVVAAVRTKRLLRQSITQTRARANLTRYLPAQISDELATGRLEDLRRGKREEMAVLFVDMRGFTALSEGMGPEEVSAFVSDFRSRLTKTVLQCGGIIDKFMGDAALIVFPARDDAARAAGCALRCARRIQADMADWSRSQTRPVQVGVGAHWGLVFSGVVGDETRLEYSVFGDAVNVAARLEEMTKARGVPIIVSRDLLNAAGDAAAGDCTLLGRTAIRGRDEEVDLLALIQTPERPDAQGSQRAGSATTPSPL
ncbi:MAG: adenylate/guanylate cyclase domain-containing protein [Pseudomonadota bacterium]